MRPTHRTFTEGRQNKDAVANGSRNLAKDTKDIPLGAGPKASKEAPFLDPKKRLEQRAKAWT